MPNSTIKLTPKIKIQYPGENVAALAKAAPGQRRVVNWKGVIGFSMLSLTGAGLITAALVGHFVLNNFHLGQLGRGLWIAGVSTGSAAFAVSVLGFALASTKKINIETPTNEAPLPPGSPADTTQIISDGLSNDNVLQLSLNFTPNWVVKFKPKEKDLPPENDTYQRCKIDFMNVMKEKNLRDLKVYFDDSQRVMLFAHSKIQMRAIVDSNVVLQRYFYSGRRCVLRDKDACYMGYLVSIRRPETYVKKQEADYPKNFNEMVAELEKFADVDIASFEIGGNLNKAAAVALDKYPGLIVGEHDHQAPLAKEYLIANMSVLKAKGVTTLFLEHLHYDTMQDDLDTYFATGVMNSILESYLKGLFGGKAKYYDLVVKARENGIRIVGIDTEYSSQITCTLDGNLIDRHAYMNYSAMQIINKQKGEGKFAVLCGSAHACNTINEKIPGLSEILGCPNIAMGHCQEGEKPYVKKNDMTYHGARCLNLHVKVA